ncbi:hypothetical protein [Streptomyces sp. NPDC059631]|uniref:hypothetical protein n=1 Tax=unclassified Streptomyces TaxID=2593676 RepID=UPI00367F4A94
MSRTVDIVLLAALAITALAWALDLGSRKAHLMAATGVVLALNVTSLWQDDPWYIDAVYGGLAGLLVPALHQEIVRRKAAKTDSESSS